MANWIFTLEIKDLISDDDSPTGAVNFAKEIVKRLKECGFAGTQQIINYFNKIKITDADPLAEVNEGLDRLYDWADTNRVWLK